MIPCSLRSFGALRATGGRWCVATFGTDVNGGQPVRGGASSVTGPIALAGCRDAVTYRKVFTAAASGTKAQLSHDSRMILRVNGGQPVRGGASLVTGPIALAGCRDAVTYRKVFTAAASGTKAKS